MLNALRSAAGAPVSFSELRQAGVEFPASIVSELELSGVAIERCRVAGGREPGVRLTPTTEPPAAPAPDPNATPAPAATSRARPEPVPAPPPPTAEPPLPEDDWSRVRRYRASPREGLLLAVLRPKRLLAPVALVVAVIVVVAVVVTATGLGAGSSPRHERVAQQQPSRPATVTPAAHTRTTRTARTTGTTTAGTTTGTTTAGTTSTTTTQPAPPPAPVSPTLATQLETHGHELLTGGQYTAAVPVLERAMAATGENVNSCVDPESTMCLTYAYALYDLGRALRLSGNAAAAVPVLERRLQIDNQRPTVMAELELARQGAT
ncbi:MAG TPA: hypothetical protein VME22_02795 [Solirubrobacteraceae bacterium]|nr:hypothetical protein [Solirubrobacteraceae bacterium]